MQPRGPCPWRRVDERQLNNHVADCRNTTRKGTSGLGGENKAAGHRPAAMTRKSGLYINRRILMQSTISGDLSAGIRVTCAVAASNPPGPALRALGRVGTPGATVALRVQGHLGVVAFRYSRTRFLRVRNLSGADARCHLRVECRAVPVSCRSNRYVRIGRSVANETTTRVRLLQCIQHSRYRSVPQWDLCHRCPLKSRLFPLLLHGDWRLASLGGGHGVSFDLA